MEYINFGGGKMLLTLSAEDLKEYGDGRAAFIRHIMNDVHKKYGDDVPSGKLFVQMYESKGGGCELFVTRLRERRDTVTYTGMTDDRMLTEYRGYIAREVRAVYEFDEMEKLLLCCKLLDGSGYSGRSESYADRAAGKFYLVIDGESSYPAEAMGESCPTVCLTYIREHCTRMFGEHAAALLGRLAQ